VLSATNFLRSMLNFINLGVRRNDWISLDLMRCALLEGGLRLVFLIDLVTEGILRDSMFELSPDSVSWVILLTDSGTV